MKRRANAKLEKALKELLDLGEIVVGAIRVNDGVNVTCYTALSACPIEHREGYRRALETGRNTHVRDVVYEPEYVASENATSIASMD